MKFILAFIISLCACTHLQAQGYNNLWLMGFENFSGPPWGGTNIDFLTGSPNVYYESVRVMQLRTTDVCVTDSVGNLLFYSNGAWIANKENNLMLNGDSLNPSHYTSVMYEYGLKTPNSHIALKLPNNDSLYFLIHETLDTQHSFFDDKVYYSIINMNADSGRGAVIDKNHVFLQDTIATQMAVCKHANGRDWWIVIPQANANAYYVYLLTPLGITYSSKQFIGTRSYGAGQAAFSRDGTLYASYDTDTDLEVFDFDRCTGVFSNARHVTINDGQVSIGVSISPSGRFIYASSGIYLYQFDVNNLQNYQTVAVWDSFYSPSPPFATLFAMQELMQDDKIYINTGNGTDYLHVIESPDSLGLACNVQLHGFHLPTYNSNSTPFYPNYSLGPVVGSICDSLTVGVTENAVKSADLKINPNPVKEDVWINYHFPNNHDGFLEIYDNLGKIVLKRKLYWSSTQLLLHLNELNTGIYFVKVFDDTMKYCDSKKLLKQ